MSEVTEDRLTPGLTRALAKQKVLRTCDCGFPMPVYPGRYPSKCPLCATPREKKDADDGEGTAS